MKEWTIPVTWEVCGKVKVEANTLAEALQYVKEDPDDMPLPTESDYVDGSFAPSMDEIEEIRDLYNDGESDEAHLLAIRKFASAYSYLYNDQLVAAEKDYMEWFQDQFYEPSSIDWNGFDFENAKGVLIDLLCELRESRTDFNEIAEASGLSKEDLTRMGF